MKAEADLRFDGREGRRDLTITRRERVSQARGVGAPLVLLQHPASDGLVVIEWPRNRHMGLDVSKAGVLQGPVRRDVERVGLAEEAFQRQLLEVEVGGLADAC